MNTFKDAKGREWKVEINVGTLKRMRTLAKFSLDDVMPKELATKEKALDAASGYAEFLNDDVRFSEVLYAILKPDLDAANVTQEQFDEGLSGEANQRAIAAFHGAFTDFSQNPRKTLLRGMKIGIKRMESKLATLDAMTDAEMEAMIDAAEKESSKTLKASAGGMPENSQLTLAS